LPVYLWWLCHTCCPLPLCRLYAALVYFCITPPHTFAGLLVPIPTTFHWTTTWFLHCHVLRGLHSDCGITRYHLHAFAAAFGPATRGFCVLPACAHHGYIVVHTFGCCFPSIPVLYGSAFICWFTAVVQFYLLVYLHAVQFVVRTLYVFTVVHLSTGTLCSTHVLGFVGYTCGLRATVTHRATSLFRGCLNVRVCCAVQFRLPFWFCAICFFNRTFTVYVLLPFLLNILVTRGYGTFYTCAFGSRSTRVLRTLVLHTPVRIYPFARCMPPHCSFLRAPPWTTCLRTGSGLHLPHLVVGYTFYILRH